MGLCVPTQAMRLSVYIQANKLASSCGCCILEVFADHKLSYNISFVGFAPTLVKSHWERGCLVFYLILNQG